MTSLPISIELPWLDPTNAWEMRSFAVAAPVEWNKLPQASRTKDSLTGFEGLSIQISLSYTIVFSDTNMDMDVFWQLDYPFLHYQCHRGCLH